MHPKRNNPVYPALKKLVPVYLSRRYEFADANNLHSALDQALVNVYALPKTSQYHYIDSESDNENSVPNTPVNFKENWLLLLTDPQGFDNRGKMIGGLRKLIMFIEMTVYADIFCENIIVPETFNFRNGEDCQVKKVCAAVLKVLRPYSDSIRQKYLGLFLHFMALTQLDEMLQDPAIGSNVTYRNIIESLISGNSADPASYSIIDTIRGFQNPISTDKETLFEHLAQAKAAGLRRTEVADFFAKGKTLPWYQTWLLRKTDNFYVPKELYKIAEQLRFPNMVTTIKDHYDFKVLELIRIVNDGVKPNSLAFFPASITDSVTSFFNWISKLRSGITGFCGWSLTDYFRSKITSVFQWILTDLYRWVLGILTLGISFIWLPVDLSDLAVWLMKIIIVIAISAGAAVYYVLNVLPGTRALAGLPWSLGFLDTIPYVSENFIEKFNHFNQFGGWFSNFLGMLLPLYLMLSGRAKTDYWKTVTFCALVMSLSLVFISRLNTPVEIITSIATSLLSLPLNMLSAMGLINKILGRITLHHSYKDEAAAKYFEKNYSVKPIDFTSALREDQYEMLKQFANSNNMIELLEKKVTPYVDYKHTNYFSRFVDIVLYPLLVPVILSVDFLGIFGFILDAWEKFTEVFTGLFNLLRLHASSMLSVSSFMACFATLLGNFTTIWFTVVTANDLVRMALAIFIYVRCARDLAASINPTIKITALLGMLAIALGSGGNTAYSDIKLFNPKLIGNVYVVGQWVAWVLLIPGFFSAVNFNGVLPSQGVLDFFVEVIEEAFLTLLKMMPFKRTKDWSQGLLKIIYTTQLLRETVAQLQSEPLENRHELCAHAPLLEENIMKLAYDLNRQDIFKKEASFGSKLGKFVDGINWFKLPPEQEKEIQAETGRNNQEKKYVYEV